MPNNIGKIFMHGRSQAIRLPKEFRLPGKEVRITKDGDKLILEPVAFDVQAWLAKLDALRASGGDFLPEGRPEQPPMPDGSDIDFDK